MYVNLKYNVLRLTWEDYITRAGCKGAGERGKGAWEKFAKKSQNREPLPRGFGCASTSRISRDREHGDFFSGQCEGHLKMSGSNDCCRRRVVKTHLPPEIKFTNTLTLTVARPFVAIVNRRQQEDDISEYVFASLPSRSEPQTAFSVW